MKRVGSIKKRGISPVIATVLLITLVVIIAVVIFLWARSFVGEAKQKQGASAEQKCSEINLQVSRSSSGLDEIYVSNVGDVPVYSLQIKMISSGRQDVENLEGIDVRAGGSGAHSVSGIESAEDVKVVPILLVPKRGGGEESYTCENAEFSVDFA